MHPAIEVTKKALTGGHTKQFAAGVTYTSFHLKKHDCPSGDCMAFPGIFFITTSDNDLFQISHHAKYEKHRHTV